MEQRCPYLVDVTNDWLWQSSYGVYCRQPDGAIRVPAATTLATRCLSGRFEDCMAARQALREGAHHEG